MGGSVPPPPPPPPSYNPPPPPPPPSYNPPPPPPPPMGNTQYGTGQGGSASSNAVLSLVLGIAAWVIGCTILTAIPAWILGKKEINAINEGRAPEAGRTMATIGMWLGIVHCILAVLGLLVFILLFALGLMGAIVGKH